MAIKYTEKGYGLHLAIGAAGHWLRSEDGAWVSSDDAAVQAIIDGYSLAQAISYKKRVVDEFSAQLRERWRLKMQVDPAEMASWFLKVQEAEAIKGRKVPVTNALAQEAAARGVTVEEIADRVIANRDGFSTLEAQIAGVAGKHKDAIAACATFAAVEEYDANQGWPVV